MAVVNKSLLKPIKNMLKFNIYYYFKYIILPNNNNEFDKYKNKKKVVIMQTPEHHNLGDHAIAYAETQFVKDNLPDYEIIEIPREKVYKNAKALRRILSNDDKIIIIGGGNMGDMYVYEEYTRRFISQYFKNTKVISFPQSIDFSNTWIGRLEMKKSSKAYSKNKNMVIVAREEKSYEIMRHLYNNNKVILTPDIVLYLNEQRQFTRAGIVTCLRCDLEDAIGKGVKEGLIEKIKNKYTSVTITDTLTKEKVSKEKRSDELDKIWTLFSKSEIVITDRLHGMIFCAITGTPCIVFNNSNHKIEYTYKNWLSGLENINYINNFDEKEVIKKIDKILHSKDKKVYNINLTRKFNKLYEELNT